MIWARICMILCICSLINGDYSGISSDNPLLTDAVNIVSYFKISGKDSTTKFTHKVVDMLWELFEKNPTHQFDPDLLAILPDIMITPSEGQKIISVAEYRAEQAGCSFTPHVLDNSSHVNLKDIIVLSNKVYECPLLNGEGNPFQGFKLYFRNFISAATNVMIETCTKIAEDKDAWNLTSTHFSIMSETKKKNKTVTLNDLKEFLSVIMYNIDIPEGYEDFMNTSRWGELYDYYKEVSSKNDLDVVAGLKTFTYQIHVDQELKDNFEGLFADLNITKFDLKLGLEEISLAQRIFPDLSNFNQWLDAFKDFALKMDNSAFKRNVKTEAVLEISEWLQSRTTEEIMSSIKNNENFQNLKLFALIENVLLDTVFNTTSTLGFGPFEFLVSICKFLIEKLEEFLTGIYSLPYLKRSTRIEFHLEQLFYAIQDFLKASASPECFPLYMCELNEAPLARKYPARLLALIWSIFDKEQGGDTILTAKIIQTFFEDRKCDENFPAVCPPDLKPEINMESTHEDEF